MVARKSDNTNLSVSYPETLFIKVYILKSNSPLNGAILKGVININTIMLYKNPDPYPHYNDSITIYKTLTATPRNQDLKSGYIDMSLSINDVFSFNYLSFTRNGKKVYAWVENVEELGGNTRWRVHYSTDALRTYQNDLVLGTQYIARGTTPTLLEDELLSSTQEHNDYTTMERTLGNSGSRFAVVQVRITGDDEGEEQSNMPGQPTPYMFCFFEYDVNNWAGTAGLHELIQYLSGAEGETTNIVTIYSIPYIDKSRLYKGNMKVRIAGQEHKVITSDVYRIRKNIQYADVATNIIPISFPEGLTKTRHSVKLIFPEAGIMNVPDELLYHPTLKLRQDVDIFSGASNYMLTTNEGVTPTHLSVRGASLSTIPILSNPYDSYISQNQNTLAVGLLGDVASIGLGVATGNPLSMSAGAMGLVNTYTRLEDAKNMIPSNPPAFLGSALVHKFNQKFFSVVTKKPYDNEQEVRERYGYPIHRIQPLIIPTTGFIQTQNCSVGSNGNVPLWAIADINQIFNAGILFK